MRLGAKWLQRSWPQSALQGCCEAALAACACRALHWQATLQAWLLSALSRLSKAGYLTSLSAESKVSAGLGRVGAVLIVLGRVKPYEGVNDSSVPAADISACTGS